MQISFLIVVNLVQGLVFPRATHLARQRGGCEEVYGVVRLLVSPPVCNPERRPPSRLSRPPPPSPGRFTTGCCRGKLPCLVRFSHPTALSLKNCESVHNPKTRGFGWSPLLPSPLDLLRLQSAVSSGSFFCPDAAATSAATSGQSPPHTTATSTSPLWANAHQTCGHVTCPKG